MQINIYFTHIRTIFLSDIPAKDLKDSVIPVEKSYLFKVHDLL